MDLPRDPVLLRARHGDDVPPSPARVRRPAICQGGRSCGADPQTGQLPHASPLVCDPSTGGRVRHPNDPGAPGPQRRGHHHDLHARPQSRGARRQEPSGRAGRRTRTITTRVSVDGREASNVTGAGGYTGVRQLDDALAVFIADSRPTLFALSRCFADLLGLSRPPLKVDGDPGSRSTRC